MSNLYYRFEQTARDTFVEFLRRMYRYGGPWLNEGLEIVAVSGSVSDLVYEAFFEEQERYPVVTVSTGAGQGVPMGFNNQIENLYDRVYPMGDRALSLVEFSTNEPVAFRIPSTFTGSMSGLNIDLVWKRGYNVDDIDVAVYSGYTTTGSVLLSSGSIQSTDISVLKTFFAGVYPHVDINAGTDYWAVFTPASGAVYKIAVDTASTHGYITPAPGGSLVSGSLYGGVRYSPRMRMGGAHEFSLNIKCSAKNSMERAQDLADLAEIYTNLAKYGGLSRASTQDTRMNIARWYVDGVSYLTGKGFAVTSVNKLAVSDRRRGDNDIIFTTGITVGLRSEWYVDFNEQHVLDIDVVGGPTAFQ